MLDSSTHLKVDLGCKALWSHFLRWQWVFHHISPYSSKQLIGLKCIIGKSFQLWSWSCQEGGRIHPFFWGTWPAGDSSTSLCFRSTSELSLAGFSESSLAAFSLLDWKKKTHIIQVSGWEVVFCQASNSKSALWITGGPGYQGFCILSCTWWGEQVSPYVEIAADYACLPPGQQTTLDGGKKTGQHLPWKKSFLTAKKLPFWLRASWTVTVPLTKDL